MKDIAYIVLLLILASSCDSWLEEEVYSTLTPANFYQTENDFRVAVNGVYDAIQGPDVVHRNVMAQWQTFNMNNLMAGQMNNRWAEPWETLTFTSTHRNVRLMFFEVYADVAKANGVLKEIEETDILDQEVKDNYAGELRFLRASRYFDLVRAFGHAPLVTSPPENLQDALIPDTTNLEDDVYQTEFLKQVERDVIYDFVVEELLWCEDHLPDSYTEHLDIGRVTRGAATGMLARVYLFMAGKQYDYYNGGLFDGDASCYAKCVEKCEDLMDGRYGLVADFSQLYLNENEYNEEILFSIGFVSSAESGQLGEGAERSPELGIKGADITPKSYFMHHISTEFWTDWKLNNDSTEDLRYTTTFQDKYINKDGDTIHVYDGNFLGPLCPKLLSNITHPLDPIGSQFDYGDNWIWLRYADILLMHSEALNEAGSVPDATTIDGVNQIRARAGKDLIELPISKEALREEIWKERKWELCFEGHHYWDCVRTGRFIDEMTQYMNFHRKMDPEMKHNIIPIPFTAIESNRSLQQNFGWD